MLGTSQQCYFERIYWKPVLVPLLFILGRYFSHILEFSSEERTFSPSCSYFLSPICSVASQSCLLRFLSLALPLPVVSLTPHFLQSLSWAACCDIWVFSSSPFLLLLLFFTLSYILYFSLQAVCLSLSLHPYFGFENNKGFHWAYQPGPNIFQSIWRRQVGVCLFQGSLSLLGLWGFFVMSNSLVVRCRPSPHMHPHLMWTVFRAIDCTNGLSWQNSEYSLKDPDCPHMWFSGEMWTLCTSEELIRTLQDGTSCSRHCYIKQLIKMITAQG